MCGDIILEIFRMPETEDDFYNKYPFLSECREEVEHNYRALSRRKEILSEKILIEKIFPGKHVKLLHNDDGMPMLSNGLNVSISHTRNYIAMMVSEHHRVALDIEHISDRVKKVGRMYLREDEPFTGLNEMLVAWCAKETMYKLFSSQNLSFSEIRLLPFIVGDEGVVETENLRISQTIKLKYKITSEYIITTVCI